MSERPGSAFIPVEWYNSDGTTLRIPNGFEDAGKAPIRFQVDGITFTYLPTTRRMKFAVAPTPYVPVGAEEDLWATAPPATHAEAITRLATALADLLDEPIP